LPNSIQKVAIAILLATCGVTLCASGASAQSPAQGPGGPVLVVTDSGDNFGEYYAEILRAEGLNEFAVDDESALSASNLADYQVVLLAQTSLSPAQVGVLTTWVNQGGNLIAMRPDNQLNSLLGLGADAGNLSNGYVKVAPGPGPGAGITAASMQFHDTADIRSLAGATTVATLSSTANGASSGPAVTLRSVGSAGGQAAAFTYDLARSVVYTRQGNPARVGVEGDGIAPLRSDDLFFGNWLDFSKVLIPQADEQQRLLANLITQMNLDQMPLPRFWYLPRGEKAAVVMTGDDHGSTGGTAGQFDIFKNESPPGCSVADWECVRTTSYVYAASDFTGFESPTAYQAEGFEIALHLNTGCANYTPADLDEAWTSQLADFNDAFPGLNAPRTNRTHCITWGDWVGEPKAELNQGVRLDTNYYYWPSTWVQDRPGMFTGSGFPQRFADEDGSLVDVYQATTQLADEALITVPTHIAALLDGALGDDGYYGVFTANMHTDSAPHTGANEIVAAAQERNVPVVSAKQMLDWLDGRNDSSFQDLSFLGNLLRFTVDRGAGAHGLQAMLPVTAATGELSDLRRDGDPVSVTRRTVKGIEYAMFDAAAGDYTAAYGGADATPPNTTIDAVTPAGDRVSFTFSSSEAGSRFECRLDGGAFAACASPGEYSGLAAGSHTVRVRAIDLAGNVDPTPASAGFTIDATDSAAGAGQTSGGGQSAGANQTAAGNQAGSGSQTNAGGGTVDRSAPRVTIVKHTVRVSAKGAATLRVTCPRTEARCRVEVRLRRAGRQLAVKTLTVAGGKTASLTLRLKSSDRVRLARARSLLVDAATTARDVAGNSRKTTTPIRLLAPNAR
jgi:hypothetical protein